MPALRRRAGVALLGLAAACSEHSQPIAPQPEPRLELTLETDVVVAGDIVRITAVVVDADGTPVPGGRVMLSTDHPDVATVDASSRLRAVAAGRTSLRGTAGGTVGRVEVEVLTGPALFALERFEDAVLPVLVAADSVDWDGEREYHEVLVTAGTFVLSGDPQPRYELRIQYQEFDVRYVGGERTTSLRLQWNEYDRGTIVYDATGDISMTSEVFAPLHHRSVPVAGGFLVNYRIPGTDDRLDLFYGR